MRELALILISAILLSYASSAQQSQCDYKVEIIANNSEFESGNFSLRVKATGITGKPTNITGIAEIEDSKGEVVRKYMPWANEPISRQKTSSLYKPNLKEGLYKIISRIDVECNDINKGNNADSKTIGINVKNEKTDTSAENTTTSQNYHGNLEAEDDNEILLKNNNGKSQDKSTANVVKKFETAYKSSSEKAKGLIIIFLLAVSVLLNIILIWRR